MIRNEILENLCLFDHMNPYCIKWKSIENSRSKDEYCTCENCTSGKTKMAVAILDMMEKERALDLVFLDIKEHHYISGLSSKGDYIRQARRQFK